MILHTLLRRPFLVFVSFSLVCCENETGYSAGANRARNGHRSYRCEFYPQAQEPRGNPRFVEYTNDTEPFDYTAARMVPKPTSVIESAAHLMKGALGGGILGVHVAYMKVGIWTACFFTVIFGCYIAYCINMLTSSAHKLYERLHISTLSYPDLGEAAMQVGPFPICRKYSKILRVAVDTAICVDLFGACTVYEIIIARSIVHLLKLYRGEPVVTPEGKPIKEPEGDVRFYTLIVVIPVILICMIRSLKYLAPFSIVANCFIVVAVFATAYYSFQSVTREPLSEMPGFISVTGFFEYAGIVIFSMSGLGVCMSIENNMKYPKKYPRAVFGGMVMVVCFVSTVGFFGYWGWGSGCKAPVTLNLPATTFPIIIKVLIAFMIYFTFPLNFYAPFNVVWFYIQKFHDPNKYWMWERVYRTIAILILSSIAYAFPKITSLMGVLGGLSQSNMVFIFPAIIETLVIWEKPGLGPFRLMLVKNILILIIGITICISSTFFNAKDLLS